mgnify:CR=1 FL=1
MLVFLSTVITISICIYYFKISPIVNKKFFGKTSKFNMFLDKSDFRKVLQKSDLISFKHEFGETIFELQKEIEELKFEINKLKSEFLDK